MSRTSNRWIVSLAAANIVSMLLVSAYLLLYVGGMRATPVGNSLESIGDSGVGLVRLMFWPTAMAAFALAPFVFAVRNRAVMTVWIANMLLTAWMLWLYVGLFARL